MRLLLAVPVQFLKLAALKIVRVRVDSVEIYHLIFFRKFIARIVRHVSNMCRKISEVDASTTKQIIYQHDGIWTVR